MKRFLVPLFALFVASSCGNPLEGTWRSAEARAGEYWTVQYRMVFVNEVLIVNYLCKWVPDGTVYNAVGSGYIKLTGKGFEVRREIEGESQEYEPCRFTFGPGEFTTDFSPDHSFMILYGESDALRFDRVE
ncbi:MAG: hypothetical protein AB1938_22710 [Myxococcota bacterium]